MPQSFPTVSSTYIANHNIDVCATYSFTREVIHVLFDISNGGQATHCWRNEFICTITLPRENERDH